MVKRPGSAVNHPPVSSAEVKERVEQYLHSPVCAFMTGYRANLPLTLPKPVPVQQPAANNIKI